MNENTIIIINIIIAKKLFLTSSKKDIFISLSLLLERAIKIPKIQKRVKTM
jgi:hypothetical protein